MIPPDPVKHLEYIQKAWSAEDSSGTVLFLQELDVSSTAVAGFCHLYNFGFSTGTCMLINTPVCASVFAVNLRLSVRCELASLLLTA